MSACYGNLAEVIEDIFAMEDSESDLKIIIATTQFVVLMKDEHTSSAEGLVISYVILSLPLSLHMFHLVIIWFNPSRSGPFHVNQ